MTTNGSLLNNEKINNLINLKFDKMLISFHSGNKQNYHDLQGGDFNQVLKKIQNLIKFRNQKGSKLPIVLINCLLFKLNQYTIKDLLKKMKEIGVDGVNLNQYYACRNKIKEKVSFYFEPEIGNKFLTEIYDYAKFINLNLKPEIPNFLFTKESGNSCNNSPINTCDYPWKVLKLKGCLEFKDSLYVCVCNRIMLFRLNYKEFKGDFLEDIWNHKIIRYLRKYIVKNSICQFCQNPNTPILRCLDNKQYQIKRDKAVRSFFISAFKKIKITQKDGIYLLNKNPYEYIDYYDEKKKTF